MPKRLLRAESVSVRTANLVAEGEGSAAHRQQPSPLLGGYAEEYVWVQVEAPAQAPPAGDLKEAGDA